MANFNNHPRKQFCKYGHDTFICGRRKSGNCCECERIRGLQYYKDHTEQVNETNNRCYARNKEKILKKQKIYEKNNWDKILAQKLKRRKIRHAVDPIYRLKERLRGRLYKALIGKRKVGSAVKDMGCTGDFLKQYIESKFYGNMSWDNWGTVWQLDHIIPLWKFDLENKEQFLKAVNYKNLQPLTILEHMKKSAYEVKEWIKWQWKLKR